MLGGNHEQNALWTKRNRNQRRRWNSNRMNSYGNPEGRLSVTSSDANSSANGAVEESRYHHHETDLPLPLAAVLSVLVAVVSTLASTANGPGLDADSLAYYSAGLNWAEGRGLQTLSGTPLTMFPPGIPAIIAFAHQLGLSPDWAMRILNTGASAGIVVLGYQLARRYVRGDRLVGLITVLLSVNVALLNLSKMALSECLFLFVCLAFISIAEKILDRGCPGRSHNVKTIEVDPVIPLGWLAALAVVAWLGFTVRYAGVVLIPVGFVTVISAYRAKPVVTRLINACVFAIVASIGPVLVMLHNHSTNGTLMGSRTASGDPLPRTIARFVGIPGKWLLPDPVPEPVQSIAGLVLAISVAAAAWKLLVVVQPERRWSTTWTTLTSSPLIVFSVVYSLYIISAQTLVAFDLLDSRLMSPLVVPAMIIGTTVVDRLSTGSPDTTTMPSVQESEEPLMAGSQRTAPHESIISPRTRTLRRAGFALLACLVSYQAGSFLFNVIQSGRDGVGYASRQWRESEILRSSRTIPDSATIYSNTPAGVWSVLRREPILKSPAKTARRSG